MDKRPGAASATADRIDVGLFSFLKKKNEPVAGAGAGVATRLRGGEPTRITLDTEAERERQREIARATAAKIDAIELAMASDIFNEPEPAWGSEARRPAAAAAASPGVPDAAPPPLAQADETPDPAAQPASAPVAEESAILYANGAADQAEQLLRASLGGPGRTERLPWWMLFDLYQASAREDDFDSIAIDYASHFETSPPGFTPLAAPGSADRRFAGVSAAAVFAGVLDDGIDGQLQRLLAAGAGTPVRLEFLGLQGATADGCARLLAALQALRSERRELVVAGAEQLIAVLRPMLAIGERGNAQAPWLLLLELLQLLNREKDFEETAMDYCVTYEVSPPSFEPPAAAAPASAAHAGQPDAGRRDAGRRFMLPALVEGDSRALLAALEAYAAGDDTVVLDCSRLARIDYAAATALHGCLAALAAGGRRIELRDLNHLVAVLLRLLGYAGCARLYAHKY
jgi:ABC-type transporter Mla MlaB component